MYERSKVFRYSLERSKATLFSRFDKEENWLIGGARSTTRWPSSAATPWRNIYLALFSRFRAYASYFARINWSVLSTRMCIFPYVIITSRDKVNLVAFNSIVQSNEERERERGSLWRYPKNPNDKIGNKLPMIRRTRPNNTPTRVYWHLREGKRRLPTSLTHYVFEHSSYRTLLNKGTIRLSTRAMPRCR